MLTVVIRGRVPSCLVLALFPVDSPAGFGFIQLIRLIELSYLTGLFLLTLCQMLLLPPCRLSSLCPVLTCGFLTLPQPAHHWGWNFVVLDLNFLVS